MIFDLMQKIYAYIQEEDYENAYKLIKPAARFRPCVLGLVASANQNKRSIF